MIYFMKPIDFQPQRLNQYLSTGVYVQSAAPTRLRGGIVSLDAAPPRRPTMTLAEHDRRFHPGGYNPKTDTCEFRERRAKLDPVDAEVGEGGISGLYTGSAASYARPSLIHVGTGEGSQVYGWGLYASNVRGVAEGYSRGKYYIERDGKRINYEIDDSPIGKAAWFIANSDGTKAGALKALEDAEIERGVFDGYYDKARTELENNFDKFKDGREGATLYEQTFFTNRAPGDESHLLSWYEKPTSQQKRWISKQLEKEKIIESLPGKKPIDQLISRIKERNGISDYDCGWIYNTLVILNGGSPKAASEFLARADIDGIKYPVDSYGGKTVKDGDKEGWNYVSFRDDNIRIDRKFVDGKEVDVKDTAPAKPNPTIENRQSTIPPPLTATSPHPTIENRQSSISTSPAASYLAYVNRHKTA